MIGKLVKSGMLLAGLVLAGAVVAQEGAAAGGGGPKLGLAERRALKAYQDGKYPELLKEIRAAAGFELEVEVVWETIAKLGQAESYGEPGYWTDIYFVPLAKALARIGQDEMGKTALQAGLKKVVVRLDEASAPASNYPNGLTFEGGTLTINWHPYSNTDDVDERVDALVKTMEPKL